MQVAALSDIGKIRNLNQDRFLVDFARGLLVVCDGMGGHKAGEVAAQMAIDTINTEFRCGEADSPLDALTRVILEANRRIYRKGRQSAECEDMGTTITAACLRGNHLYVANIGDSSLYIIRQQEIVKVTADHTLAEKLYQEGLLNEADRANKKYSHVLTRALGVDETVEADCYECDLQPGDYVFLATDGLTDLVEPEEIMYVVTSEQLLDPALARLLQLALDRGGHDNITMILLLFPRED
jgi:serine/threonine protein phosphatase PrpC